MPRFIMIVLVAAITGCFYSADVTNDPDFYAGYRKGQVYETKIDLYIIYGWDNYLMVPGKHTPRIDKYQRKPSKYTDIKGILKKKSMVRVEKLSYRRTFEASYFDIHAKILDGEYKDDMVKLNFVSQIILELNPKNVFLRKPDPAILKLIENSEK